MSNRMHSLIALLFIGFCITHGQSQDRLTELKNERVLLDRHVLSDIERFAVHIVCVNKDEDIDASPWNVMNDNIKKEFDQADIDLLLQPVSYEKSNTSMLPLLEMQINTLEIEGKHLSVYHIQTVFKTRVCLDKQPKRYIKADVWKTEPVMKAVPSNEMPGRLTKAVSEQIKAFISAYKAANSKHFEAGKQIPSRPGHSAAVLPKRAKRTNINQPIHTRFVASKNSKVFHKPQCKWAQKIKPENLVIYNSRNEAVNAGKRPCKYCKP